MRLSVTMRKSNPVARIDRAHAVSAAVRSYLRAEYGNHDLSWHPLFQATKVWFCDEMDAVEELGAMEGN